MDEIGQRAREASRLLDEPLYREWLTEAERVAVDSVVEASTDQQRQVGALTIKLVREFTQFLQTIKLRGEMADRKRPGVA